MRGRTVAKWIVRVAVAVILAALVAGGCLYYLASRPPERYKPQSLSSDQMKQATDRLLQVLLDINNQAPAREELTVTLTETQLNEYLAAADEIAFAAPGHSRGEVHRQMEKAGLAEPAIAIQPGVLSLMVRLTDYDKVVSADLAFAITSDGKLRVTLDAVRVGRVIIPQGLVRERLARLRATLAPADGARTPSTRSKASHKRLTPEDVSALLPQILAAVDSEPLPTELPFDVQGRAVALTAIDLGDGVMTLTFRSQLPAGSHR